LAITASGASCSLVANARGANRWRAPVTNLKSRFDTFDLPEVGEGRRPMRTNPRVFVALVAVIAGAALAAAGSALAAELQTGLTRPSPGLVIVSSDATSQAIPLVVNKSVVVDLPTDVKDVLVGSPLVVNAVMRTNRRAYISGVAVGQTNVFFFDKDGRPIGGLDIYVTQRVPLSSGALVSVYRNWRDETKDWSFLNCTQVVCAPADLPGFRPPSTDQPQVVINNIAK
jgi:putative type II/III system pilus formation protein